MYLEHYLPYFYLFVHIYIYIKVWFRCVHMVLMLGVFPRCRKTLGKNPERVLRAWRFC